MRWARLLEPFFCLRHYFLDVGPSHPSGLTQRDRSSTSRPVTLITVGGGAPGSCSSSLAFRKLANYISILITCGKATS
jgi:hypothetical protein